MKKLIYIGVLSSLICISSSVLSNAYAREHKDKLSKVQKLSKKINLNSASISQLVNLPGIGKKKAQAIVEYRNKNGKFNALEDLTKVKGIGNKILEKLKPLLVLH